MLNKSKKSLAMVLSSVIVASVVTLPNVVSAESISLKGQNRYETSLEIVKAGWVDGSSKNAIIASGVNMADALSATPLAYKIGKAPIFLTDTNKLTKGILSELSRLGVTKVYIAGGIGAVSENVENELKGFTVERLAGKNRFETSLEISKKAFGNDFTEGVVVNGLQSADALSISSIAANKGMPVLLVNNKGGLTVEQKKYMSGKVVYAIGGKGVLSDSIVNGLKAERIEGLDRYKTNRAILVKFAPNYSKVFLAKGTNENLIDALAGSAYASKENNPIILVNSVNGLDTDIINKLKAIEINSEDIIRLGGGVLESTANLLIKSAPVVTPTDDSTIANNTVITSEFTDSNFKTEVYDLIHKASPAPILYSDVKNIKSLHVPSKNISSLNGIEYFTSLTTLFCESNQLTYLDVSKNTALTFLGCGANLLNTLDVSKNTKLTTLVCINNQLTSIDVSKNTALTWLICYANQLTTLDVSKNTALTDLSCESNQLTTLDTSKNTALTNLSCGANPFTTLDVSKNTALTIFNCLDLKLTTLDVSKNIALTSLQCNWGQLTTLDVSNNKALTTLGCGSNKLTTLDVSKNTALTFLACGDNQLTTLDLSKNTVLTRIFSCRDNQIKTLYFIRDMVDSNNWAYKNQYTDSTRQTTTDSLVITIKK